MHSEPKAEEEHIASEDYKKSDIVFGCFGAQNDAWGAKMSAALTFWFYDIH